MISISQFTDIAKFSRSGWPKNFGRIYLEQQILPSIFKIIRNNELSAQFRFFIWQTNLFVELFILVALFFKIINFEENILNKRSMIGTELSLVRRTKNHIFMARALLVRSKQHRRLTRLSKGPNLILEFFTSWSNHIRTNFRRLSNGKAKPLAIKQI